MTEGGRGALPTDFLATPQHAIGLLLANAENMRYLRIFFQISQNMDFISWSNFFMVTYLLKNIASFI